jgi:hypothetical protein
MKKIIILALIFCTTQHLFAQVEITPFYGWLWTGSVPMYSYPPYYNSQDAVVDDKANYGVRLGTHVRSGMMVEFEWNHTESFFNYTSQLGANQSIPFTSNYYLLGGMREIDNGNPAIPFGLFNIGMTNFKNTEDNYSRNMFTVGLGGGIKYFVNDKIGIRLQARLLFPMQYGGVSFGCGIGTGGGGCGTGVSSYTSLIQGDFTGGIILKLGGEK